MDLSKFGVLFTHSVDSTNYSIAFQSGRIEHNVYDHGRQADGHFYTALDGLMGLYGLNVLWVHPDAQFSLWLQRSDFDLIPSKLRWWTPSFENSQEKLERPFCIRLGNDHVVMFPAYAHLKHSNKPGGRIWDMPDADTLLHSVEYVQRAFDVELKYTAGSTAINMLRAINQHSRKSSIIKSMLYDRWGMVRSHTVTRPIWVQRDLLTKKQGLTEGQKSALFVLGGDKNAQFLGACKGLVLPTGEPSEITNWSVAQQFYHDESMPSLWQYILRDVSGSAFNSYDLPCPLSTRDCWASGELLRFFEASGIVFELVRGLCWQEKAGAVLDTWAEKMWFGISGLRQHEARFPDEIARGNALGTGKFMYVDVIGRFNNELSKEYYQRAWNTLIIHRAIRNQAATFQYHIRSTGVAPVLVVNDAFYVVADETDLNAVYPGILDHKTELRGYKQIGVCPLSDTIVNAFSEQPPNKIEAIIQAEMKEFSNATI